MEDNSKTVDIDDFKKEAQKRKWKEKLDKVKQKANDLVKWGIEHPIESMAIIGAVTSLGNKAFKYRQTRAEDTRRLVDFYDTRLGRHVLSRRPLTRHEQIEVDRRFNDGESYTQILADLGLLK